MSDKELDFELGTQEDRAKKGKALKEVSGLPAREEIIILSGGRILIDIEGPLEEEELGEPVPGLMLCG